VNPTKNTDLRKRAAEEEKGAKWSPSSNPRRPDSLAGRALL
jgi:hypothetical protein